MLGRFFRLFLAMLLCQVVILFLSFLALGAIVASRQGVPPVLRAHTVLWIEIGGELPEYPTLPEVPFVHEPPISQTAILEALDLAAHDAHVEAAFLDLDFPALGWGMAHELRLAIGRFRAAGKRAVAFGPVLDEVGLYLAAACDSVFVPPHGKVALNGLAAGWTFYKGLFDKVGVRANVHRIGAYKGAAEPYVRSGMSEESRRNAGWLLDELWSEFRTAVIADRKLDDDTLGAALDFGTLQPEEAVELRLADGVRQRQDVRAMFETEEGTSRLVRVEDYRKAARPSRKGPAIAVVHTAGFILRGKNGYNPALGLTLGDASAVRDLEDAALDDDVAAIVLRIDSPGGEVVASDVIGHAVERARAAKPVVVSMVDVAASGGYMMAYRAHRIVALPTTITGSIGSFTGKFVLRGLYDKIGVTKDFVTRGTFPLLESDYRDWSASEESLVARQHWEDYERWIDDIAASRDLEPAEVDSVARGRVWSGRQALDRRLVDELGDLRRAIEVAQQLAEIPAGETPRLVHYPRPTGLLDLLEERGDLFAAFAQHAFRAARLPQGAAWAVLDLRLGQ